MHQVRKYLDLISGSEPLNVLKSPGFSNYLLGQSLSAIGTGLQQVALGWFVWRSTHSAWTLAAYTAIILAGQFLFSFAGGCLADKYDRLKLLMALQWGGAVIAISVATLVSANCLPLAGIFALALAIGVFVALEYPLRHALSAELVPADKLVRARGYYSSVCAASIALGQASGGLIISTFQAAGETICACLNALSFFLSLLLLRKVLKERKFKESALAVLALQASELMKSQKEELADEQQATAQVQMPARAFENSLKQLLFSNAIFSSLIQTSILVLFGTRYFSLLPAFAGDVFHGGARESGLLTAAFALGFSAGALICGSVKNQEHLEMLSDLSLVLLPLGLVMFCICSNFSLALLCVFFMAACQSANINCCICLMQTQAPERFFGRLMGIRVSVVALCDLSAAVVVSLVVQHLGLRTTVVTGALICLGLGLLALLLRHLLAGSGLKLSAQPLTLRRK